MPNNLDLNLSIVIGTVIGVEVQQKAEGRWMKIVFSPSNAITQTDSSVFTRSGEIKKMTLFFEHHERFAGIFFRFLYAIYL